MLQLIALLLCVLIALLSTIPLQIAWMSASPNKKGGVIAGLVILVGGTILSAVGVILSFAAVPSLGNP